MCGYLICCAASTLCVCIRFPFRFSVYPSLFFSLRRSFSFTPQLSPHIHFISIALLVLFCLRTMWMRVCVCVMVCPYHHQIYGINPFYSSLHSISMNTHRVWVSCFEKQRTQTYLNMYKKETSTTQHHNSTLKRETNEYAFLFAVKFSPFFIRFLEDRWIKIPSTIANETTNILTIQYCDNNWELTLIQYIEISIEAYVLCVVCHGKKMTGTTQIYTHRKKKIAATVVERDTKKKKRSLWL